MLHSFETVFEHLKQQQRVPLQTRIDLAKQTPAAVELVTASASPSVSAAHEKAYTVAASEAAAAASGAKKVKQTGKKASTKPTKVPASGAPVAPELDSYSRRRAAPATGWEPYVVHISGPILVTAPHGLKIFRGGRAHDERLRVHKRERYSTEIALLMAQRLGPLASFIVWNCKTAVPKDKANRDPNYLLESQFADCVWHQALEKFVSKFRRRGLPSMHIDVHGKCNRKKKVRHIDLGIEPLIQCCEDPEDTGAESLDWTVLEARLLQSRCAAALDKVFDGVDLVGKCVRCDAEPYLCGLWGHGCEHTISHQSVRLGVPAFQLEIPLAVRRHLWKTKSRMDALTDSLTDVFRSTVLTVEQKHHRTLPLRTEVDVKKEAHVSAAPVSATAEMEALKGDSRATDVAGIPVVASTDAGVARAVEEMLYDVQYFDSRSTAKQI